MKTFIQIITTFLLILIIAPCTIIGAYEVRDYLQENPGEQFETETHIEDIAEILSTNQYIGIEIFPDHRLPSDDRIGTMHGAVLYYEGPSKVDPTKDTLIHLHWFNVIDSMMYDDITYSLYKID